MTALFIKKEKCILVLVCISFLGVFDGIPAVAQMTKIAELSAITNANFFNAANHSNYGNSGNLNLRLNGDGSVLVGTDKNPTTGSLNAYVYDARNNIVINVDPSPLDSSGLGRFREAVFVDVSANKVAIGNGPPLTYGNNVPLMSGFIWDNGTTTELPTVPRPQSFPPGGPLPTRAIAISSDGNTILADFFYNPFLWKRTDAVSPWARQDFLNPTNIQIEYIPTALSGDGSVIVGSSMGPLTTPQPRGFRGTVYDVNTSTFSYFSTPNDLSSYFSTPSGSTGGVWPTRVSSDGKIIVGNVIQDGGSGQRESRAFKFDRAGGGFVLLGNLQNYPESAALDLSSDGSVVVGTALETKSALNVNPKSRAVKFHNGQVKDLGAFGNRPNNSSIATSVSEDGKIISGFAEDDDGQQYPFIYSENGGQMVNVNSFTVSLTGVNGVITLTRDLATLPLEGAHHRPLASFSSGEARNTVWATGDLAADTTPKTRVMVGEVGVSRILDEHLIVGASFGRGLRKQDLPLGGVTKLDGNYILGEMDYILTGDITLSTTGILGFWEHHTTRAYAVAGGYDNSQSTGDTSSLGIRNRIDGPKLKIGKHFSLEPFAAFTFTRTKVHAFEEVSGSYPARFNEQSHLSKEGQLGVAANLQVTIKTKFRFSGEIIRRFDRSIAGVSGSWLNNVAHFSFQNPPPIRNQARFGVDVDHTLLPDTLLNVSSFYSGEGSRPGLSASTSLRLSF